MATTSPHDHAKTIKPAKLSFLDLPGELRNKIYRSALITGETWYMWHFRDEEDTRWSCLAGGHLVQPKHAALLRTSKQVYHETLAIFYEENKFHYNLNNREWSDFGKYDWYETKAGVYNHGWVNDFDKGTHFGPIRDLKIMIDLDDLECPLKGVVTLFETLFAATSSLKKLAVEYDVDEGNIEEFITCMKSSSLAATMAWIEVEKELWIECGIGYLPRGQKTMATNAANLFTNHMLEIAAKKSWAATEYRESRGYVLRPRPPQQQYVEVPLEAEIDRLTLLDD